MKSKTLIALICLSIPLEGAGSSLVNAGTIEALREGDGAVRCTADATVTVNGGTVLSIACAAARPSKTRIGRRPFSTPCSNAGGKPRLHALRVIL